MPIAVIMSTFNGQKYIREQIDSVLNQSGVEVELFVRDDGSSDGTALILEEYKEKHGNVHVSYGNNIGFRQSFIQELIKHEGFEYYAFCDQDDYWEKRKLNRAIQLIGCNTPNQRPTLYYSNLYISDENLNPYRKTKLEKRRHSLESVIMRRSIAGCTMVMNQNLWKQIAYGNLNDDMLKRGHDSFIITLCYAIGGRVICDDEAHILYRQHADNTSGSAKGIKQRVLKEWRALKSKKGQESGIAASINDGWADTVTSEAKNTLSIVSNMYQKPFSRMIMVLSPRFSTGVFLLTAFGKIKVLTGLL